MPDEFDIAVAKMLEREVNGQRKYASFFHSVDKKLKERDVVRILLREMAKKGDVHITGPVTSVDEREQWPDCRAKDDKGQDVAIEVTELVSQEAIEANQHGDGKWCWWSDASVMERLEKIIREKDQTCYHGSNYTKVVLVVNTDEPALDSDQIGSLVQMRVFAKPRNIDGAYLLMSYHPLLGGGYYPYFKLTFSS